MAIAVERDVLVHSAREDILLNVALKESKDGVLVSASVACPAVDAMGTRSSRSARMAIM